MIKTSLLRISLILLFWSCLTIIHAQNTKIVPVLKGDYLGQSLPGDIPEVFARGIISTVKRKENGWSKPINVGHPFNTEGDDRPPIITEKGNAYTMGGNFAEDKVNYLRFNYTDGKFSLPTTVSTYKNSPYWWPLYISPDESYIIIPSAMEEGFGRLDLYVCFKDENDAWGEPRNLGPEINTKVSERFPVVLPDGKYLFFMRHTESWDIFWCQQKYLMS